MARSEKSTRKSKDKKRGKSSVKIDFEGVESGGRTIADGWASARIVEAELVEAESSGNEMFKIVMECKNGKEKAKVWDNLVLTPNALWKLKSLLEAASVDVPESEMEISAEDLMDLEFDVEILNETYEGRERPRVTSYAPAGTHTGDDDDSDDDEEEEEDEEEEAPSKKKKSKSKSDEDDEDEDSEEDDDDDSDDDDEDDEPPKRRGKAKSKPIDDDEDEDDSEDDEDDEEDDEEDEDEKPEKKGKKSKSKLRAGVQVNFEHKGKTKIGVITSIDDDTVFVEDKKGVEWELSEDEITVLK